MVNASGRLELVRSIANEVERAGDVVALWADVLTDPNLIRDAFHQDETAGLSDAELSWCHAYCTRRCSDIVSYREERMDRERDEEGAPEEALDHDRGIDGAMEKETTLLDREDDALLLQLRTDLEQSKSQLANPRLTAVQDLTWALINSPAFLFNH